MRAVAFDRHRPSAGFPKAAKENLAGRALVFQGSASSIPLDDASMDVVVSGLVLNFVPDPRAALVEMMRVARHGGTLAAYVWDYSRARWSSYATSGMRRSELDPGAASLHEGARFHLCRAEALSELFASAQLDAIETTGARCRRRALPVSTNPGWSSPADRAPAPAYAMPVARGGAGRLRDRLRERVGRRGLGRISLVARARAIRRHRSIMAAARSRANLRLDPSRRIHDVLHLGRRSGDLSLLIGFAVHGCCSRRNTRS